MRGAKAPKFCVTTQRDEHMRPAPDLVDRNFVRRGPNELWVADVTYIPTWSGFVYLAVVLDAWSRRVVGWAMDTSMEADLVVRALEMAVRQRRPGGVVHHSDQGSQYTSHKFNARCRALGVTISMGSVGDAYDNAMCESFFATLKVELVHRRQFQTRRQAELEIFQYIEGWYNTRRRHSAIGYISPMTYESQQLKTA